MKYKIVYACVDAMLAKVAKVVDKLKISRLYFHPSLCHLFNEITGVPRCLQTLPGH